MDQFEITIIGAGVVGLAVAEVLAARYGNVLVIEKNTGFGQETSSRNSEVIHAGLYYPAGSLKAALCREGNRLLYETCTQRDIPFRKTGKLIVATASGEEEDLRRLRTRAEANGVCDLSFVSKSRIRKLEPEVKASEGLLSPSTGIIDSHALMRSFYLKAGSAGALIAFRSEATAIHFDGSDYEIESNAGEYRFKTRAIVNSAGLHAERVAAMAGIDTDRAGYRLRYCKGSYFSATPSPELSHLVYPVPTKNHEGLGIHATPDLGGRIRFGPDVEYIDRLNYEVDEKKRDLFHGSIQRYLPGVSKEALNPDMCGIRPKLQGPGEPIRDFLIRHEGALGLRRMISLIGIESPGLTSCIPIANRVRDLIREVL